MLFCFMLFWHVFRVSCCFEVLVSCWVMSCHAFFFGIMPWSCYVMPASMKYVCSCWWSTMPCWGCHVRYGVVFKHDGKIYMFYMLLVLMSSKDWSIQLDVANWPSVATMRLIYQIAKGLGSMTHHLTTSSSRVGLGWSSVQRWLSRLMMKAKKFGI